MIVSVLGAGGLTQLANIVSSRARAQAYAQGAVDRAMKSVSDQLDRADKRLDEMERHRDECEAELERGRLERAELRDYVATWKPGDPLPGYVAVARMQEPK